MNKTSIGKLERVPLRQVWEHEAYDFTRWLQENIDVLNNALTLNLVNVDREQTAGGEDTKRNLKHGTDRVATHYAAWSPVMLARTVCLLNPSRRLISRYDWLQPRVFAPAEHGTPLAQPIPLKLCQQRGDTRALCAA